MVAAPVAMTICHGSNGERISFTESSTIFGPLYCTFRNAGVACGISHGPHTLDVNKTHNKRE